MTRIASFKDLYLDVLRDLWSANDQNHAILPRLQQAATNAHLKQSLETGAAEIMRHQRTVEQIIRDHNEDPRGEHCRGMEGLVREAEAHVLNAQFDDGDVRDAMIITQAQRTGRGDGLPDGVECATR